MISRAAGSLRAMPRSSAAARYHFDRQLRQNPARFIRSIFCTSTRSRKCCTSLRKAAASSSVRVLSSIGFSRLCRLESILDLARRRTRGWSNQNGALLLGKLGVGKRQQKIGMVEPVLLVGADGFEAADPLRAQAEWPLPEAAVEQQLALRESDDTDVKLDG